MTPPDDSRNEDIIPVETARTLAGLFRERVRRTPEHTAYRGFDRGQGEWIDYTWSDMAQLVGRCQEALAHEDLHPGDRIAILMRNCKEWVTFNQGALGMGLVVVPLYVEDRPDNVTYILGDAAVKLLVIQDIRLWRRLKSSQEELPELKRVIIVGNNKGEADETDERVVTLDAWLPDGTYPLQHLDGESGDLASIVYTSGTTGRPKGVMLSHINMLSDAHAGTLLYDVYLEDLFLSFLPLSHTFERTVGYYLTMMTGSTVAYARSIPQLAQDLKTIRPTALIAVPRIFEKLYERITQQLAKKSFLARGLFRLTVDVGWKRFERLQGHRGRSPLEILWPLLYALVGRKLAAGMGGRMRIAVSGGAALPFPVARTLIGLGFNIVQGYGLTEAAPVISGNPEDDNRPASVGVPLAGVELRIGENNELLARSPGVMLGYWNNHAATRAAIDSDGWLHTGDQARIEDGYVYITGRIKDILVLSNGEKVPPADMEEALIVDPLFEQAMVIGEGHSFLSAILVLNKEAWVELANRVLVDPYDTESLKDSRIEQAVHQQIKGLLKGFPGYAKIRKVVLSLDIWDVDSGLVTPTLKVKRAKVMEAFEEEINRLYS